jgi:predicted Zn-dependent protease
MTVRDFPSALSEIEAASALDPESTAILADKGLILYNAGRRAEGTALLQRLEQAQPDFLSSHVYLASFAFDRGDDEGFLHELATAATEKRDAFATQIASAGARGLQSAGHSGMLKAMLAAQQQLYKRGAVSAYDVAKTFAYLGDADDAIVYLKASLSRHETDNIAIGVESAFAGLNANPDFRNLVQQAGLKSSSA